MMGWAAYYAARGFVAVSMTVDVFDNRLVNVVRAGCSCSGLFGAAGSSLANGTPRWPPGWTALMADTRRIVGAAVDTETARRGRRVVFMPPIIG